MDNVVKHLLVFGSFRLDPEQRLLLRDQQPIPFSPKAFELLVVLVQRSGELDSSTMESGQRICMRSSFRAS